MSRDNWLPREEHATRVVHTVPCEKVASSSSSRPPALVHHGNGKGWLCREGLEQLLLFTMPDTQ